MDVPAVHILGLGAATPIGRTVWASAAAARAGLCGFSEHPLQVDAVGEPIHIARAPWLDLSVEGVARYCELLFPALDEAIHGVRALSGGPWRLGLTLALPSSRPGRPEALKERLTGALTEKYPGIFTGLLVFETGHAAGYAALDAAVQELRRGSIDACVVAGVDSYLSPETLQWIEECDQLHGAGALNNAWGFIPGEAAGAVLVATPAFAREVKAESYGAVVSVGLAHETKLIKTDAVCIGEGLTHAVRAALAVLPPHEQIQDVYCDLNGETYRADEYGFTALRTKERFRAATDFVAPADCWGDIGAAGATLHAALGLIACRKNYRRGPVFLVCASSETGERGAAVIRAVDPAGE